jgi:hypothetical protein
MESDDPPSEEHNAFKCLKTSQILETYEPINALKVSSWIYIVLLLAIDFSILIIRF